MERIRKTCAERYAGDRKPTNVIISEKLTALAKAYFPTTRHKSLSVFLEHALRTEFRRKAPRIRAAGLKLPESVFSE